MLWALFCLFPISDFAQVTVLQQKTIGSSNASIDEGSFLWFGDNFFVHQIAEQGASFDKNLTGFGDKDGWLMQLDQFHGALNERVFGGSDFDAITSLNQFSNGDWLMTMQTNSENSGNVTSSSFGSSDNLIMRLDSNFAIVWQVRIGGSSYERAWEVLMLENDEFIVACTSGSGTSGNKTTVNYGSSDVWLVKMNDEGTILWQKSYGGTDAEFKPNLAEVSGRLFLAMESESPDSGNKTIPNFSSASDIWLLEINSQGEILNELVLGGTAGEGLQDLLVKNNRLYVLSRSYSSMSGNKTQASFGGMDAWLVKLNLDFQIENQWVFGGAQNDLFTVIRSYGNYFYLLGNSESDISGNKTTVNYGDHDMWLMCLDTNMQEYYQAGFGGDKGDFALDVFQRQNGRLDFGGISQSNSSGNKMVNTYENGMTHWLIRSFVPLSVSELDQAESGLVYPNPIEDHFTVDLTSENVFTQLAILDLEGKVVHVENIEGKEKVHVTLPQSLKSGTYILSLSGNGQQYTTKVIF